MSPAAPRPSVLFVCVHNAGRSQMAAALLTHFAGAEVEVRPIRDEIEQRVRGLPAELGITATA
ncbi:hypothetical protein [Streptomyces sp. NBC_00467]|uniref:hypothetical protein n=1 Tax=Streptomyces sp. NBC_00467 TaxID=2975752 RepID=UPI003FA6AD35